MSTPSVPARQRCIGVAHRLFSAARRASSSPNPPAAEADRASPPGAGPGRSLPADQLWALAAMVVILLVAWMLAMDRLGERSFWADEGHTALLAERSDVLGSLRSAYNPPHLLLTIWIVRLSRSEFALRLPSAFAYLLTLPLLYRLGARLLGRQTGLAAAFLLALSRFAIGFAQEARIYALLMMLSCLSLLLLLTALDRPQKQVTGSVQARRAHFRTAACWVGYSCITALVLYSHYFGWLVLGAEVSFSGLVLVRRSLALRRLDGRLASFVASLALIGLLYLPWLGSLAGFFSREGPGTSNVVAGLQPFRLSIQFLRGMLIAFGADRSGWPLLLYGLALLLGLASLVVRRAGDSLLLFGLWLGVPITVLTVIRSDRFFEYRYLIFLLPMFLLMVAHGAATLLHLGAGAGRLWRSRAVHPARSPRQATLTVLALVAALFVPANYPALHRYHRWEKENWRTIGAFMRDSVAADEAIYVSPRYWGETLEFYEPGLRPQIVGGSSLDPAQLKQATARYGGLWFLRYAGPLADPSGRLGEWIDGQDFDLLIDGGGCGAGIHVYYRRAAGEVEPRRADLLGKAALFCSSDPRWR